MTDRRLTLTEKGCIRVQRRILGLRRFQHAQDKIGYDKILRELNRGEKETHWSWFVFPQPAGLGTSYNSCLYAIRQGEGYDYLNDFILAQRLYAAVDAVARQACRGRTAEDVLGIVDAQKYRACLRLFAYNARCRGEATLIWAQEKDRELSGKPPSPPPAMRTGD